MNICSKNAVIVKAHFEDLPKKAIWESVIINIETFGSIQRNGKKSRDGFQVKNNYWIRLKTIIYIKKERTKRFLITSFCSAF